MRLRPFFGRPIPSLASLGPLVALVAACGGIAFSSETIDKPVDAGTKPNPPWDGGNVPPLPTGQVDAGLVRDASTTSDSSTDPGPGNLVIVNVGAVTAGKPATFQIPAHALGFNIVGTAKTPSPSFGIDTITAPGGAVVHSGGVPANGTGITSMTFFGDIASAGVPQSNTPDAVAVTPGTWSLTVSKDANVTVSYQTTPDGAFHGALLDVNFYVPDGLVLGTAVNGTNATDAPNNPDVQARVSAFFNDIRNLYGISRGTVTYVPLPAKYRAIEEQDLEDAWKQTKATPTGRGAHIILSEAVADWWGIASGIPGAANSPGTDQSGLILSSIPQGTPEEEAFVMAHELGHFMGLNHTTEISGQDADPLEDTPQCDHVFDETCPDFNNIMAPTGALVSPILTSALQRRVVTGSPILRALLVGDPPVAGKAFSLPPNWKRIFGHPSTALSAAERAIASSFCGRPFKLSSKTGGTRAEWTRLATNPALPRFVRMRAQKALAR